MGWDIAAKELLPVVQVLVLGGGGGVNCGPESEVSACVFVEPEPLEG